MNTKEMKEPFLFLALFGMQLSPKPEICEATWKETGEVFTYKDLMDIFIWKRKSIT